MVIIITVNKQQVLPTIISRCQCFKFLPVAEKDLSIGLKSRLPEVNKDDLLKIVKLSSGRPGLALKFLTDAAFYQNHLKQTRLVKDLTKASVNGKFKLINDLLGEKETAQAKLKISLKLIESLEIFFRDTWLAGKESLDSIDNQKLLKNFSLINLAREQLRQNVQPKLVLESLFLNV